MRKNDVETIDRDSTVQWKIWGSKLGRNKRSISSPNHPHQLQRPPSIQLNENQSFFSGSKVTSADSLTTHICLGRTLKFSGALPPLNLSSTYVHISKQVTSIWSYKGTFLHITYLSHAHCMTHLFYLHLSNYINIINSSNNEHQYIIFCVLLLLTPSTGQIFS